MLSKMLFDNKLNACDSMCPFLCYSERYEKSFISLPFSNVHNVFSCCIQENSIELR